MPNRVEFIVVADVGSDPREIVKAIREYAAQQGGDFAKAADEVSEVQPILGQFNHFEYLLWRYAPKGYKALAHPTKPYVYGFELVGTQDHC